MKALYLVNRMCFDSKIAEVGGTMTMLPLETDEPIEERLDAYCEGYFGTIDGKWNGRRECGAVYFYLYIPIEDEESWYRLIGELPDAYFVCEKEQDIVALWKMEE